MKNLPVWRSLLYVPTHVDKFVDAAHSRGADAVILDLEDSVPPDIKAQARAALPAAAAKVGRAGADVLVRINSEPDEAARDIEASVGAGVAALSLAKVETVEQLRTLDAQTTQAESRCGVAAGHTRFIVLIESAAAFLRIAEIAAGSPRNVAMTLGAEDFSLDLGVEPNESVVVMAKQQLIIAAAAAGIMPLGVIGGVSSFSDPVAYLDMAKRSRRFGYAGASCIHPSQTPLLNEAFGPEPAELDYARRVEQEFAEALKAGKGAFKLDGKMIDAPIVARARKLLARQAAIDARQARLAAHNS